jgi:predicted phage terminase large subunit-like protein
VLVSQTLDDELNAGLDDFEVITHAEEQALYERSLYEFMRAAWNTVEPTRALIENWHIRELCQVCEEVTAGTLERVIINIPPGTLKSLIVSVFWPAWMWARNPGVRVLAASYGEHLSIRDNLRVRELIESPWFQSFWPIKLSEEQNTKRRYNTHKGGWRIATSVGGPGTGEHPHYIVIDDPLTALQAESAAARKECVSWYDQTVSSRGKTSGVKVVVIMQRLHKEDLTGHLLAKDSGWVLVRFPMRYEKCTCPGHDAPGFDVQDVLEEDRCLPHKADPSWAPDERDPRTVDGELLCEALINNKSIKELELDLGAYGTAGQLQQRPVPSGGGLFKRAWFRFADKAPEHKRVVRGWDTAGTENDGDYTVGARISEELEFVTDPDHPRRRPVLKATGRFYVEDVVRDQLGPDGVNLLMKSTADLDGHECAQREEREGGGSGKAVIEARRKLLVGYDYTFTALGMNKALRAKPFRAQVEGGNVYLVRGPWNEAYLQEMADFPTGKHDDQVDASSCAFNAVLLEPLPRKQRATW